MEIKKEFTFSGDFKKCHAEDSQPIKISNGHIYCYTNGMVYIEIDADIDVAINEKKFSDRSHKFIIGKNVQFIHKTYEGDYGIEGKTKEGWYITARVVNHGITISFSSENSPKNQNKSRLQLNDVKISYNSKENENSSREIKEVVYGLGNLTKINNISTKIGDSNIELVINTLLNNSKQEYKSLLSAEMKLINLGTDARKSHELYYQWITHLLSFATGREIYQVYKITTFKNENSLIQHEYWSGRKLYSERGIIAVMQLPHVPQFIHKCSKLLTWETFNDKGLSLAFSWYFETFNNNRYEVNFLLLCTVLEVLNKKHSANSSKRIFPKSLYKKIRQQVLKLLSEFLSEFFKENIKNGDKLKEYNIEFSKENHSELIEKFNIFEKKVKQPFECGSYNQIGNLRTSLQEMLQDYHVPYKDICPNLEFIKVRDKLVHEGISTVENISWEFIKLSNLIIRVFLAILEYNGAYVEHRKITLNDELGRHKYDLAYKEFNLTTSSEL